MDELISTYVVSMIERERDATKPDQPRPAAFVRSLLPWNLNMISVAMSTH